MSFNGTVLEGESLPNVEINTTNTGNFSRLDDDNFWNTSLQGIIVPVVFGFIFVIGVLGNSVMVYILLTNQTMKNIPNIFILNLSIGDLLALLFCVPFISMVYTLEEWPFGSAICKLTNYMQEVSVGVSVFTLSALSYDRYHATANPICHRKNYDRAKSNALIKAGVIWIVSLLLGSPDLIFSHVASQNVAIEKQNRSVVRTISYCDPNPPTVGDFNASRGQIWDEKSRCIYRFGSYYLFPLISITVCYA